MTDLITKVGQALLVSRIDYLPRVLRSTNRLMAFCGRRRPLLVLRRSECEFGDLQIRSRGNQNTTVTGTIKEGDDQLSNQHGSF